MSPCYSIAVEPALCLLRITMSGFFAPNDVAALKGELAGAHRELTCGPNRHLTLLDIREMEIQRQDTLAEFASLLNDPVYQARQLAVVVAQSLARMQMARAAAARDARFFKDDLAAAERWLVDLQAQAA